jgi:hypothetical protein
MRFLMIVKASPESEAGVMPGEALLAAMARYNEELVKAGVLLDGSGLHPSSKGARVTFSGAKRTVTAGPFPNPKDLIAGYWLIDVKSRDDAIDWAKRVPFDADPKGEAQIEIRQLFELDDFAPSEAIEQHRELDKALARKKK